MLLEIMIVAGFFINLGHQIIGFSKLNREVGEIKTKIEMHLNTDHKNNN